MDGMIARYDHERSQDYLLCMNLCRFFEEDIQRRIVYKI